MKCQSSPDSVIFFTEWENGKRLAELRPPDTTLRLLGHDEIAVVMKARDVLAQENGATFAKRSEVELRCRTLVQPSNIADGNSRPCVVPPQKYSLRADKDFAKVNLFIDAEAAVNVRLGLNEEFQSGQHGQFSDLIDTNARAEFRRSGRAERAGFKLKIAYRR